MVCITGNMYMYFNGHMLLQLTCIFLLSATQHTFACQREGSGFLGLDHLLGAPAHASLQDW